MERYRLAVLAGFVALGAFLVDLLTKEWAVRALDDRTIHIVWTLQLQLHINKGAAFGLGSGLTPLLTALTVVVLLGMAVFARKIPSRLAAVGLGLLVGGAMGNLFDRIFRDYDGGVVDFIDLQWWPIFNVADACIVIGAVCVAFGWGKNRGAGPSPAES